MSVSTPTFSRESDDYTASWHCIKMIKNRNLTPEMVNEAIEEGEPIETTRGDEGEIRVNLRHEWGSMTYEVTIAVDSHTVVTACESGRGK